MGKITLSFNDEDPHEVKRAKMALTAGDAYGVLWSLVVCLYTPEKQVLRDIVDEVLKENETKKLNIDLIEVVIARFTNYLITKSGIDLSNYE
jgi:hypothetical protein